MGGSSILAFPSIFSTYEAKTSVELWISFMAAVTKRGSVAIGNNNVKDFTVPAASAPGLGLGKCQLQHFLDIHLTKFGVLQIKRSRRRTISGRN